MQATDYLKQLKEIDFLIRLKQDEYQRWKMAALNTTSYSDGERVQASSSQQRMADAIARYIDLERETAQAIAEQMHKQKEILETLMLLSVDEYAVLHMRYYQRMKFEDIAAQMFRSLSWVKKTKQKALRNLQAILDERETTKNE